MSAGRQSPALPPRAAKFYALVVLRNAYTYNSRAPDTVSVCGVRPQKPLVSCFMCVVAWRLGRKSGGLSPRNDCGLKLSGRARYNTALPARPAWKGKKPKISSKTFWKSQARGKRKRILADRSIAAGHRVRPFRASRQRHGIPHSAPLLVAAQGCGCDACMIRARRARRVPVGCLSPAITGYPHLPVLCRVKSSVVTNAVDMMEPTHLVRRFSPELFINDADPRGILPAGALANCVSR